MKNLSRIHMIVLMILLWTLGGCAAKSVNSPPSKATTQTRALQPSPGKALVYYVNRLIYVGSAEIALDGMSSPLERDTYIVWEVAPGEHHLEFKKSATIFTETVGLDIFCEAEQIYYFHMIGNDRETHEIVQVKNNQGREAVEMYTVAAWFRDGESVPLEDSE